ncbi:MAG: bifunctional nuclease family protein [Chloroflexi bacterium]|nr:bifunctional nuclease family protein [Chloroflexota bacterium]
MRPGWSEVEVRGVRMCVGDPRQAMAHVVRRGSSSDGGVLCLCLCASDGHALLHELRDQETSRSQALRLASRIAEALGGRLAAVHLAAHGAGLLRASLAIEIASGSIEVPTEPGQALALAVCLKLPLLADGALFPPARAEAESLGGPLVAFLDTLDLSGLN